MARLFFQDRRLSQGLACALLATLFTGCGGGSGGKPSPSTSDEAGKLFSGPAAAQARGEDPAQNWTIAIVGVKNNKAVATQALDKVQNKAGLHQAYLDRRGDTFVVAFGTYPSPADPKAQADLKRIQNFEFEGGKPFASAVLAPPDVADRAGSIPELDLLSIKNDPLANAKYTLQVGVYGRLDNEAPSPADLAQFRKAAEEAAVRLRREGDEAFYYHGPTRSMVLIGAFDDTEYDPTHPGELDGPRLKAAREKFPYNLVNGAGYKETPLGAKEGKLQKSRIVMIPK